MIVRCPHCRAIVYDDTDEETWTGDCRCERERAKAITFTSDTRTARSLVCGHGAYADWTTATSSWCQHCAATIEVESGDRTKRAEQYRDHVAGLERDLALAIRQADEAGDDADLRALVSTLVERKRMRIAGYRARIAALMPEALAEAAE